MRVLIVYNQPVLPADHPEADSECEILSVADSIATHLGRGGFDVSRQAVGRDLAAIGDMLRESPPDVVVNLFEGFGDDPNSECRLAQLLEEQGIPFTGASSQSLWQAGRKDIAKQLFREAGLSTPASFVVDTLRFADCRLNWPVIVKPAFRDASVGINQASVVMDQDQLDKRVAHVANEYGFPVLVEEFIHGREISAAIVDGPELLVLPLVETLFVSNNGNWPIDSYDAKWQPGSRDYEAASLQYPAELAPHLADRVAEMAQGAFNVLGCRGFATADFRLSDDGTLYLLELNPNANLNPSRCLTELLSLAGIQYTDFLVQLVSSAAAAQCSLTAHAGMCQKSCQSSVFSSSVEGLRGVIY